MFLPAIICKSVFVSGATYADCNGQYNYVGIPASFDPEKPVYKHEMKNRYIFYNVCGWSIGKYIPVYFTMYVVGPLAPK